MPGKCGIPKARDVGRTWVSLHWTKPEHMGSVVVTAYKVEGWILGEEARWQEVGLAGESKAGGFVSVYVLLLLCALYENE